MLGGEGNEENFLKLIATGKTILKPFNVPQRQIFVTNSVTETFYTF